MTEDPRDRRPPREPDAATPGADTSAPGGVGSGAGGDSEEPREASEDTALLEEPVPLLETPPGHRSGFVTIAGRPNSGKSTLLNSLVNAKVAIVSPIPQTTRNRITGIRTLPNAQIVYLDTPGIHKPQYEMNRRMLRTIDEATRGIDLLLLLVDVSVPFGTGDRFVASMVKDVPVPKFLVLNKVDLIRKSKILEWIDRYRSLGDFKEFVPVSALKRDNIERLESLILANLPEGPRYFPPGITTDQPERFLVGELIREAVFLNTREEIPHSTAVLVESIEERAGAEPLLVIHATVNVEKESQKGIVIGARGSLLKTIGTSARHEIERILHCRVYLDLRVQVLRRWREDPSVLDRIFDPS